MNSITVVCFIYVFIPWLVLQTLNNFIYQMLTESLPTIGRQCARYWEYRDEERQPLPIRSCRGR